MIRKGKYKYIHYVEYAPELFDQQADPEEDMKQATDLIVTVKGGEIATRIRDKECKFSNKRKYFSNGGF